MTSKPISRRDFLVASAVLGVGVSTCGLTACAGQGGSSSASGTYKAGTYEATGEGKHGDVPVSVEFSSDKIVSVNVGENNEVKGGEAIDTLPAAIVEAQSTDVDTISGATVTSEAIISAVDDCIDQAKN